MSQVKNIHLRDKLLFLVFGIFTICCISFGFILEEKALLIVPILIPITVLSILNFKAVYFLLLALIPLSIEFNVTSSLATDLPTEPLMILISVIVIFHLIKNIKTINFSIFKNWISVFLIIHLFWIFTTTISSTVPIYSIKYLLAKLWYIFAFTIASLVVIKSFEDVKKVFWSIYIPLTLLLLLSIFRHALIGFSFDHVNSVLTPFFRNHVNYAAILAVFFPFIFFARKWYAKGTFKRNMLNISVFIYLTGIYLSYTRACYLAVFAMVLGYFIFRLRLVKFAIPLSFILLSGILYFVINENHYLAYTPTTNTVTQNEFSDLIDATFKAEDVSSMERIYRWIAAIHMANDKPIMGFGPSGFVPNYENYTVFIFETWISDNKERSGVHNYFLMTLVEQGIIGLVIFFGLLCSIFIFGEKLYHSVKVEHQKNWSMAVLLSTLALTVNLLFSDMIEVDKTGSFFFLNIAFLLLIARNFKGLYFSK